MKIEELDVSEECLNKLRDAGITTVDEIVEFFKDILGQATFTIAWGGECHQEVLNKLKLMGLLPKKPLD